MAFLVLDFDWSYYISTSSRE